MVKKILFIFIFFLPVSAFPQGKPEITNIDTMLHFLEKSKDDTNKVKLLGDIAHYYSTKELEKAVEFAEQSLFLAKQIKYRKGEGNALVQIGYINNDLGKVSSGIADLEQAIEIANELNDKKMKMSAYNNLGISYFNRSEYNKALEYYLKYTVTAEDLNDLKYLSRAYNNVANVYIHLTNYNKALEYHLKGLEIAEKLQDKVLIAGSFNNIGIVHNKMGKKEKALEYYFKTLQMAEELNHKLGMTFALNNIGTLYSEKNEIEKALPYILRALKIKREIGERRGIANTLNNAGSCYIALKKYDDALNCFKESVEIADETGDKNILVSAYKDFTAIYTAKSDYKNALKYSTLYANTKDSVFNKESSEQIAEMQTRFETEKKEKELKIQATELEKIDAVVKQQNFRNNALMAGLALVLALSVAVLIAFRQKQQNNKILTEQNQRIIQQNKIIEKAHSILQNKNNDITESILYAQRIQQAILPMDEEIQKVFPDSFIFYKPRDMVSGDFYWFSQVGNFSILAVADCTGHGVPGAFMSMIGNDMLNQVVSDESVSNPAEALELMDKKISNALSKSETNPNTKDGIEMAMCAINLKEKFLRFSGANLSMFFLRNGKMEEIKSSHHTLGISSETNKSFEMQTIRFEKNDCIYLFTDGYSDQFGGEKNKKFMSKRFKELILSVSQKPVNEQKQIIEKIFEDWKGKQKQVDDVCLVGIRL